METSQTVPQPTISGNVHSHTNPFPIVKLEEAFSDARGSIQPLVDENMKSAVLIASKKGTVRANHFHKTDWHYCYVMKGSIDYHYRPAGSKETPARVIIKEGECFFTPPLVEHAMVFLQDTEFLCLGKNSREQTSYENDITRIELVDPNSIKQGV